MRNVKLLRILVKTTILISLLTMGNVSEVKAKEAKEEDCVAAIVRSNISYEEVKTDNQAVVAYMPSAIRYNGE